MIRPSNPLSTMRKIFIIISSTFFIHSFLHAQVISGIINKYTRVTSLDTCAVTAIVRDPAFYQVGDKVLLMQMNGATMLLNNNNSFGTVQSLSQTGKYEINQIDSIIGTTVYFKYKFLNNYPTGKGVTQMISFPSWNNVAVNDTLRAKPWDGETGGIVAFEANTVTLNAPILATGIGYRGGAAKTYNQCEAFGAYNDFSYALNSTSADNGGQKGEGVVLYITGKECGKGPQANGGGGGNNHKSGGGGGGHLTAGGQGGDQERANILRCPGKNPGLGGLGLSSSGSDQVFFGGGGGAGQNKEGSETEGGNGGGIVIIKANSLEGNNKFIMANGVSARFSGGDGAGGGGAGGTILLQVGTITGSLSLEAKGGNGGNSTSISGYDFGPGGGGAGGRILLSNSSPSVATNVAGGNAGRNQSTVSFQNAAKGGNGIASANNTTIIPVSDGLVQRKMEISTQPTPRLACVGDTTTLTLLAQGTNLVYEWQINKSAGYERISNDDTYEGVSTPTLKIKKVSETLNPYLYRCVVKSNCSTNTVLTTSEISLSIKTPPIPIFTHAVANNTVSFNNGSSGGLSFKWTFGDGESDTLANPMHTYALQDTYRVILKASNQCGTTSYDALINLNTPPFAGFTANGRDACPPSTIFFTNGSSDNVRKFFWSFPGGTPDTSNAKDPAVTYSLPGIYDVRLIVENGYGRDTFLRKQYVKINDKPVVNFTASKNGLSVNFINNTTNATSFLWNFGDGKISNQVSPQYTYQNAGTYIVRLSASNICGNVQDSVKLVIFSLPAATISASQTQGCAPMIVQYSGRNTTNVTSWNWSFPGGTPATSNQANPRVTYFQPGKYDIILSITNSAGTNTIKQDTSIWVSESPKAAFNLKVTSDMVEVFNTSTNSTHYAWDFGDGSTSEDANPAPHRYNKNGLYTIILLTQNDFCASATEKQAAVFFTATDDLDTEGGVKAYPNPTNGKLYLEFQDGMSPDFRLNVFSPNGQVLKNKILSKEKNQELDISDFTEGVYFLQFINEKQSFVKRVVKL